MSKNRIRELRKEKGLTLKELSQQLKDKGTPLSASSLIKYERGERNPKLETWIKLADFFNVPVSYLQGNIDDSKDVVHDFKLKENFYNTQKFVDFIEKINKRNDESDFSEENFNINDFDDNTKRVAGNFLNNVENLTELLLSVKLTSDEARLSLIRLFSSMTYFINTVNIKVGKSLEENFKLPDSDFDKATKKDYSNIALTNYFMLNLLEDKAFNSTVQKAINKEIDKLNENTRNKDK